MDSSIIYARSAIDAYEVARWDFIRKVIELYPKYKSKAGLQKLHELVIAEEDNLVSKLRDVPVNVRGIVLQTFVDFLYEHELYETLSRLQMEELLFLRT